MNNLKEKSISYKVGYFFFLAVGIIGISKQMYQYLTESLDLVSDEYWLNPELLLTGLFTLFIFRPMGVVEIVELGLKKLINK